MAAATTAAVNLFTGMATAVVSTMATGTAASGGGIGTISMGDISLTLMLGFGAIGMIAFAKAVFIGR